MRGDTERDNRVGRHTCNTFTSFVECPIVDPIRSWKTGGARKKTRRRMEEEDRH